MAHVFYHLQFTITGSGPDSNEITIAPTTGYVKFESTSGEGSNAIVGLSKGFFTNNTFTNGQPNQNILKPHLSPDQHPGNVGLRLNNIGNSSNVSNAHYTLLSSVTPDHGIVTDTTTMNAFLASFVNATGGAGATAATNISSYSIDSLGGDNNGNINYYYSSSPTDPHATGSIFTFTTVAGPGTYENDFGPEINTCFLEGTKLYAHVGDKDVYINIEDLRSGDLINTYLHGKKAIKFIGKSSLFNNPDKWNSCLKKIPKSGSMTDDLYITGAHSILVDELSDNESEGIIDIYGTTDRKIDDKFMLNAWVSEKAESVLAADFFTIYHLVLEHDDDENKKYGIWANGLLTESQCEKHFLKKTHERL